MSNTVPSSSRLPFVLIVEIVATAVSGLAFLVSLYDPMWIESLFESSPDGGSGETEWGLTVALLCITLGLMWLTRRHMRKLKAAV